MTPSPTCPPSTAKFPVEIITEEEMSLIEAAFSSAAAASPSVQFDRNVRSIRSIAILSKRRLSGCTELRNSDIEDSGRVIGSNSPNRKSRVLESFLHRFRRRRGLSVTDITSTEWCEKQMEFFLLLGRPKSTEAMKAGSARHMELEEESGRSLELLLPMAKGNQSQAMNNQTREPSEDSSSPFYLHNGDHPGLMLVSHPLTGTNYNTWSRAISMALTAKNKLSFVDGIYLRSKLDDLTYGAWNRCNNMVISWILNSVSREIADSLMYIPTTSEIWINLRDRFHQSNALRVFQMKKLLTGLQQGFMDVNVYYTKVRTLWDELKHFQPVSVYNCGSMKDWVTYQNQEGVVQFLMGLNDS